MGALPSPIADVVPSADKRDLTQTGRYVERGKPVVLLMRGKRAAR
jgi:hypothetical protein